MRQSWRVWKIRLLAAVIVTMCIYAVTVDTRNIACLVLGYALAQVVMLLDAARRT
jgi:hypothetical protein